MPLRIAVQVMHADDMPTATGLGADMSPIVEVVQRIAHAAIGGADELRKGHLRHTRNGRLVCAPGERYGDPHIEGAAAPVARNRFEPRKLATGMEQPRLMLFWFLRDSRHGY
jgi:hypothetical protein